MVLLVLLLSVLGASAREIDQMPDLETGRKGTLSATLSYRDENGAEHALSQVSLEAYRVADLAVINGGSSVYTLTSDFAASGVVFDGMSASESNQAAKALKAIVTSKGLSGQRAVTDMNGKALFDGLEPGMYLIMQADGEDLAPLYNGMDPYLVSVPQGETKAGGAVWNYQVDTLPKAEISKNPTNCSIQVTKRVSLDLDGENVLLNMADVTFYVGLFKDAEGTRPYKNQDYIKAIHIVDSSAGTAEFTDLAEGTYYVFETLEDGTAIRPGETLNQNGSLYTCILEGNGQQKVVLDPAVDQTEGQVVLNNVYAELPPDGYYAEGEISIKKRVFSGSDRVKVDDTFYAGVFTKEDDAYVLNQVVELEQNGTVTVPVMLNGHADNGLTEYWVFETDKNGKRVDRSAFAYEVSGEGSVKIGTENLSDQIELTNRIKVSEAETEAEKSTLLHSVRTGDDTPIMLYVVLAGASVLLILVLLWIGRRRHRH